MEQYDLITIGDITNDAFIKLNEKSAHACLNSGRTELCLEFGDKLPYDFVQEINAVGNASNAAIVSHKLGLKSAIITDLGDDENGKICLNKLKENHIATEFVKIHKDIKTNYNFILWFNTDRTILVRHEKYPYQLPEFDSPKWIYLTSLGENADGYYTQIENYLENHPEINLAFQPGTFQIKTDTKKLSNIYQKTKLLVLNKREAQKVLRTKNDDVKILLKELNQLGPKITVITDGENGAYMLEKNQTYFVPIFKNNKNKIDGTGSGDTFAATMTSFLILGKTPQEAFLRAPINASFVITEIGAQAGLLTRDTLENYLKNPPENYKISQI